MTLEPQKAENYFVYRSSDEEGKAFLVHGSHGEGVWCCDVSDYACDCDLFHLYLCLSPPPSKCRPYFPLSPVYSYLCCLSVCCQFILFVQAYQCFSLSSCFSLISFFSRPPGV